MIKINQLTGATHVESEKIYRALSELNEAWISITLKNKILTHLKFDGTLGFENTDDPVTVVYANMQAGDVIIDIDVYTPSFWRRFKNIVVGYESPDGTIHQNRTFLDRFTMGEIANNIAHETMHKLGYEHDFSATTVRPWSAPYSIGDMVQRIIDGRL